MRYGLGAPQICCQVLKLSHFSLSLPFSSHQITNLAYWWTVSKGYVTEEDIKACSVEEHDVIDRLYDRGTTLVGVLDKNIVESNSCP